MNLKNLALESAVVMACYLILTLPLTSATKVNIIYDGNIMEEAEYNPHDIVNLNIDYVRDPSDIAWANVRVSIKLESASTAYTIARVYLYKCGTLSPSNCLQKTPEVFDTYVNTEIAWNDIGKSVGSTTYPEEGNILFLVKLEDPEGLSSWIGLWNTIRRNSYKEFLFYQHELPDIDVHASSSILTGPIATYIQNFNTIPFKWLTKVVFEDATSLSAIGGDDSDLESSPPNLQSVSPSAKEITVINKENYFVFPETPSGYTFPITLEMNPDFECGDRNCESNLGENQDTCCFDCKCSSGYYCDAPQGSSETGICKNTELVDLDIVGTPSAEVENCDSSFQVGITARINNVPASMSDTINGVIKVEGTPYAVSCQKESAGLYQCGFTMRPTVGCGSGTRTEGPNELALTIMYMDGPNQVTEDLTESFPTINLNYDCSCPMGDYCDTGTETCEREEAVTLGVSITKENSFLEDYEEGDQIQLKAKIFNPPTGTNLVSAKASMNLSGGTVHPGTTSCSGPSVDSDDGFVYDCSIPFEIQPYSETNSYTFFPNVLTFDITFNDGPDSKTMTLSKEFGPITIPSQDCGNGVPNTGETPENCCQDVGCKETGTYCDVTRGCTPLSGVTLAATPYPLEFEDCKEPHDLNIKASINNAPYGVRLDSASVTVNNQPVAWALECPQQSSVGGVFNCVLGIPPIEGCEIPYQRIGPIILTFDVSFPEGTKDGFPNTLELNSSLSDVFIKPIPHIDGVCEPGLGENGSTACLDCPCEEDPAFGEDYYCDASRSNPKGSCLLKNDIELVVESPTSPVYFDSCEEVNKAYVLMYVKNQPSGMNAQNVYATVNGTSAYHVACKESEGGYLESNITFNCTIRVPPVDVCERGKTYQYSDNSISLVITYDNGDMGQVIQTLSHDLPDFFSTQSYRSIYEIMEDARNRMGDVLDNIMDLTEDLADAIHDCIKWQITMLIMSVVLSLAMGFGAGAYSEEGNYWRDFSEGVSVGSEIGTSLQTGLGNICKMYEEYNKALIKLEELQMDKIALDVCLSIRQHDLDAGRCTNNEQTCFDNMVGCLSKLNDMNDILDDISTHTEAINRNAIQASNSIENAADALGDYFDSFEKDTLFRVSLGGKILKGDDKICKYTGVYVEEKGCDETPSTGYVRLYVSSKECNEKHLFLVLNPDTAPDVLYDVNKDYPDEDVKLSLTEIQGSRNLINRLQPGKNEIHLFCSARVIFDEYEDKPRQYDEVSAPLVVYLGNPITAADDPNRCNCKYEDYLFDGKSASVKKEDGGDSPLSLCGIPEENKVYVIETQSEGLSFKKDYSSETNRCQDIEILGEGAKIKYEGGKDSIYYGTGGGGYKNFDWWKVSIVESESSQCKTNYVGWIPVGGSSNCMVKEYEGAQQTVV